MNIAIDSGNSFTKIGIFKEGKLAEVRRIKNSDFNSGNIPEAAASIIISTVSDVDFNFLALKNNCRFLSYKTPAPILNKYGTKESLGMDRLAAVAGAKFLYPSDSCLVINCGTCITYDFITQANEYEGGSISPGINLRFRALNSFTARLPLVEPQKEGVALTGKTTEEAILSGVMNGLLAEVEGIMNRYQSHYPGCKIIISGGDSDFFERNIKGIIFVVPDLVLLGLNSILEYNESL